MDLIYFIAWMLFFPITISICGYIDSKYSKKEYSQETSATVGFFMIVIWFYVGYLLY